MQNTEGESKMNDLYVWKKKIEEIYAQYARYIEMIGRFILALLVFNYVNGSLGYMSLLDKGIVVLGASAVCALLPALFILVIAVIFIILHVYSLSMVLAGCVAIIFLMMFIVHFRFTSELVIIVLVAPLALHLNIPYILPVICGLLVGPMAAIPMACGVVTYYLLEILESLSSLESVGVLSADGVVSDIMALITGMMDCKEMIFYIAVLSVGVWVVTGIRRIHMDYAWKIAIGSGIIAMIITAMISKSVLECEVSTGMMFIGCILAAGVGIVVEFLFLSVNYRKTELLEFEDDDYYYCVKAVPKINDTMNKQKRERRRYEEAIEDEEIESLDDIEAVPVEGVTTIIETEEIERELRSHARKKATDSNKLTKDHLKANYKVLKDNMKRDNKKK